MTLDEARKILDEMRCIPRKKVGLYNLSVYLSWVPSDTSVTLDGEFTADQLEAIAVWMREYKEQH